MALTIAPITDYAMLVIPSSIPKGGGFNVFPPGTVRLHDGGKWALYYYLAGNTSYMVIDVGTGWKITPILGKVKLSYAQSHAKATRARTPCCQEE